MKLETIFLFLFIAFFGLYAVLMLTASIAAFPWGIIGLVVLLFVGFVAWRLISEHRNNAEDRYYEKNFDK